MSRIRILILGGLALALFAAGSFIGASIGEEQVTTFPTIGLYQVEPRSGGAGMPDELAPVRFMLRADGELLLPNGNGGFAEVKLPLETKASVDALLRDAPNWKDDYPATGLAADTRMELRLGGDHPRTISIESPLYNRDLPDALYRLLISLSRPTGTEGAATPVNPNAVVFHLVPTSRPEELVERTLPESFDAAAASSAEGLRVTPADIVPIVKAIPELDQLTYPSNRVAVKVEGKPMMLVWTPDWSGWVATRTP